ncbi:MAG TPA: hypothetical protein VFN08_15730 [Gemmatimonadales bacterium]|nr:hypothetical protein [Gemmatimonadales bacterium]
MIETSSDDADTTLITFDDPNNAGASCYNMVPWGVDMWDPIPVDTPQGDGLFEIHSDIVANAPSPPSIALGAWYTPPQAMIEFDPPISRAEFYYSRMQGSPGLVNGQPGQPDAIWVYARSRTPGTINYQTYDAKLLQPTQPRIDNPHLLYSVWAPTQFNANTDAIQWLWFDGATAIDNLKIVRHPLICTPATVTRGQQVSCKVTSPNWSVSSWDFAPDNTGNLTVGPVHESSTSKEWKGIATLSGLVTAHVTSSSGSRDVKARFTVTNRSSPWGTAGNWTYFDSVTSSMDVELVPTATVTLGRNCADSFPCPPAISHVMPDPNNRGAGFTGAMVPTGPNNGYWYVDTYKYGIHRHSKINPTIYDSSHWVHPVANPTKQCRQALGFGPKDAVSANWARYSGKCQGVNMPAFVSGALGHEGMGYGGGVGHESLARAVASDGAHDPNAAVENQVFPDFLALDGAINQKLLGLAADIDDRADDDPLSGQGFPVPHGNWPAGGSTNGTVWNWNGSTFTSRSISF